ncbi:MerR family transcriptional regulator [Nocardia higoensis]|uniref:MerR family transcriptional regulator n=1 Tax=Nocardia higoensis TaxID=228599 RepID=A0ABS0D941_9NOCA|nr:MerR family transcriptional regulator [Nocardia higoensis]MBF6354987.1 MerR family transcriptional regulator [Nocardia higoensis]
MTGPGPTAGNAEAELTVSAAAHALGIPVATLRSWNQRYDLGPSNHRPGSHRTYAPRDIAVLARMVELVRTGVSTASAAAAARAAADPAPELGDVRAVLTAAEGLRATELLALLTAHFAHFGVATTWNRLCRPAFADLVTRQLRDEGLVDVEHVLSWAITTALHRTAPPVRDRHDITPVLLACTAGENHVLPLEILRAALAESSIPSLLLGASVPGAALADAVAKQTRSPILLLWSQRKRTAHDVSDLTPPPAQLLLAGPGWAGTDADAGALRVHTLEDAVHHIERTARAPHERG